MKPRFLLIALAFVATAATAMAQVAPSNVDLQSPLPPGFNYGLRPDESSVQPLEMTDYMYVPRHFIRLNEDQSSDSNRGNIFIPRPLGPWEMRGVGEMFVPGVIYNYYKGLFTQYDTSKLGLRLAAYEQFQNAGAFTISGIRAFFYRNPNGGTPEWPVTFVVYQTPSSLPANYFTSTAWTRRGVFWQARDAMITKYETEVSPEGLDTTLDGDQIHPTDFNFETPLEFPKGSGAVAMFVNEAADVVAGPIPPGDTREWQVMASFWNWIEELRPGVPAYKNMGMTMARNPATIGDTLISPQGIYSITQTGDTMYWFQESYMIFVGQVDLNAGVRFHFGEDMQAQGLRAPTPNPVMDETRIPFSLVSSSQVAIDLFDMKGAHVRSMIHDQYVPGNYDVALNARDLANGTYVVRMVTSDNVYTMKVNVAH